MRGGIVIVPPLKEKEEERFGKPVVLSTIYRMLARNGWRKLAPDTAPRKEMHRPVKAGKKTPGEIGSNRSDLEQWPPAATDVPGRGALRTHLGHPLLLVPPPGPAARRRHGHAAIHLRPWRGEPAGCFDSLVLPHVNSDCMQIFFGEIARRYPNDNVAMALDGA